MLLYDGALRHLVAAREAIDRQDLITRREALSKALAIVTELQSTLNLEEGGASAQQLDGLYTYMTEARRRDGPEGRQGAAGSREPPSLAS